MKKAKSNKLHFFAFLLFFSLSLFITFPLIFHLGDLATGYGDELNYAWIYMWIINVFLSGNLFELFNTNIFYPYSIGLSNSDPNVISSLFAVIPYLIVKQPIVVVNYTLISSLIFLSFSVYLLSFSLTKNFWASVFAGVLLLFSPAVLSFYVHLQMLAIAFVPLSLLFIIRFLSTKRTKDLVFSLTFFVLQTYNNFLAGYFIIFSYLIIFFFHWVSAKKKIVQLINRKNIIFICLSLVLIIPIMLPYFSVSKEFNYVRDIRDSVHFAIQPEDMFYSSDFSKFATFLNNLPFNKTSQNGEFKPGYLGVVFTILVVIVIISFFRKKKDLITKSFFSIAVLGFVLSLGPVLHLGRRTIHEPFLIPLPYALFYYVIPGFQGFRNSARWEMLFIIAMCVLIALLLNTLLQKKSFKAKIITYLVLFAGVMFEFQSGITFQPIPSVTQFPAVHHWLTSKPKDIKIIEMPLYNWNMTPYGDREFWRLYYSTIHFKRTVNGAGGFTPPPWQEMAYELDASFPSEKSIIRLKKMNLDYLIVHKKEFDQLHADQFKVNNQLLPDGNNVLQQLMNNSKLKFVKKFDEEYVFAF